MDRIRLAYEGRKKGKHCKAIPGFVTLNKYCMSKRNENWLKMVNEFNENLQTGFDIRSHDKNKETEL